MRIPCLSVMAAAAFLLPISASAAPDVAALDKAASAVNFCLPVFTRVAAARTPDGFSQSQSQAWASRMWNPKNPFKVPAVHQNFAAELGKRASELEACGAAYQPAVAFAEARLIQLAAQKDLSEADKNAVQASFDKYHAARQKLEAAFASLNDRHVQAFLKPTLYKYFLTAGQGR